MCCILGSEEVDEQIQLRDDMIFHLKAQMSIQQHMMEELGMHIASLVPRPFEKGPGTYCMCSSQEKGKSIQLFA